MGVGLDSWISQCLQILRLVANCRETIEVGDKRNLSLNVNRSKVISYNIGIWKDGLSVNISGENLQDVECSWY